MLIRSTLQASPYYSSAEALERTSALISGESAVSFTDKLMKLFGCRRDLILHAWMQALEVNALCTLESPRGERRQRWQFNK